MNFTLRELAREVGWSLRTARYNRARGIVPPPAQRITRGFKGEIHYWTADQIARLKSDLIERRAETRGVAVERLGHARRHHDELRELGRCAWDFLRLGPLRDELRAAGLDVPLPEVPRGRRAFARVVIERATEMYGK